MAGMKNKVLTGAAALTMATAPLVKGQTTENITTDVNEDLITVVDAEKNQEPAKELQGEKQVDKNISFAEAQQDIQRKQEIRDALEKEMTTGGLIGIAHEIKELEEKYGKDFIVEQVHSLIKVIEGDLNTFGTFDPEGNYTLDEDKVAELVKDTYFGESNGELFGKLIFLNLFLISLGINGFVLSSLIGIKKERINFKPPLLNPHGK